MNHKLVDYRLKWRRPMDTTPEPGVEVLVRFRGKETRFATMVYDQRHKLWKVPAHQKIKESGAYSSREIFAWSALPQTQLGVSPEEMT